MNLLKQYQFFPLLILCIFTQKTSATTLLEIYNLALDNDPIYLQALANNEFTQESVIQARAQLLPSLDLSAHGTKSSSDTTGTTESTDPNTDITSHSSSLSDNSVESSGYSLTLTQSIYNRATWLNLRSAKYSVTQANAELNSASQELIVRVATRYFNVLRSKDNLEFAKAEKQANARQLDQTKQRFDVGLVAITDVHESQSSYDRSVAQLIATENELNAAQEALREITGIYHDSISPLDKKTPLIPPEPADISHWTKLALDNNSDLISIQQQLAQSQTNISAQRAQYLPTVNLTANYNSTDSDSDGISDNMFNLTETPSRSISDSDGYSISLNINMNLFAGGGTRSRVRQAHQNYIATKAALEQQTRRTQRDVRNAFLGVQAGISRVKALGQAVVSSESALRASEAGFEVGTRTTVDVLLSRRQLYNSQAEYASARYDYIVQALELKRSASNLTIDDLHRINNWLIQ